MGTNVFLLLTHNLMRLTIISDNSSFLSLFRRNRDAPRLLLLLLPPPIFFLLPPPSAPPPGLPFPRPPPLRISGDGRWIGSRENIGGIVAGKTECLIMSKTIKKLSRRFHVMSENTGEKRNPYFSIYFFCYFWRKDRNFFIRRVVGNVRISRNLQKQLLISSFQWQNKRILTLAFEKKRHLVIGAKNYMVAIGMFLKLIPGIASMCEKRS